MDRAESPFGNLILSYHCYTAASHPSSEVDFQSVSKLSRAFKPSIDVCCILTTLRD